MPRHGIIKSFSSVNPKLTSSKPFVYELGRREIILVLGKTGSGKTTWAKQHSRNLTRTILADADFREFPLRYHPNFDCLAQTLALHGRKSSFFREGYTPISEEYPLMFDLARVMGPCHLILEEADRFGDPTFMAEYEELIARGRHYGVSMLCLSRYPFALPAMLRREASRIIVFRHHEPRDIDWLYKVMGDCAELLPKLAEHEFLDWTPETSDPKPQRLKL